MGKEKEIKADYRKRMQELVNACTRVTTELANLIRKEAVSQLVQIGQDEFKALETLDTVNAMSMKCTKCGSIGRCIKCGTEIGLASPRK